MKASKNMKAEDQYKTITVEAARTGWIVREKGKPAEIFIRWESVIKKMEVELTTKGDSFSSDSGVCCHSDERIS